MSHIPSTIEDISLEWVADIFSKKFPGKKIIARGFYGDVNKGNGALSQINGIEITTEANCQYRYIVKLPPSDPTRNAIALQGGFFEREIGMYGSYLKDLKDFQEARNVDERYRFNAPFFLHGDTNIVEKKGILLIEDLNKGYKLSEETECFDRLHLNLVISQIAVFHAAAVAMNSILKIGNFEEKYKFLKHDADGAHVLHFINKGFSFYMDHFRKQPGKERYADHLEKIKDSALPTIKRLIVPKPHIAAVNHTDLHRGNLLFRYNAQGSPIDVKFIDYQSCMYGRPTTDVTFFIFQTTTRETRRKYEEELKNQYYDCFLRAVEAHGITFSYPKSVYEDDFKDSMKMGSLHIILNGTALSDGSQSPQYVGRYASIIEDAIDNGHI